MFIFKIVISLAVSLGLAALFLRSIHKNDGLSLKQKLTLSLLYFFAGIVGFWTTEFVMG